MAEPRPTEGDLRHLRRAVELARRCPASTTAFSVGAVLVAGDGDVLATGYSREADPHEHAEESALAKLHADGPRLAGATLYSSLEPCSGRASRPVSCVEHIRRAGVGRIVFAWREPALFASGGGAGRLRDAGCAVVEVAELAEAARRPNTHLSGIGR